MGQCSTLPEARAPTSSARHDGSGSIQNESSSRQRLREEGRGNGLDFNKLTEGSNENSKSHHLDQRKHNSVAPVTDNHNGLSQHPLGANQMAQARDPEQSHMPQYTGVPEPMEVDQRENSAPISLPPPPEAAVRTRCYKLNLESNILSGKQMHHNCLGPFAEPPPALTCSTSEDSSTVEGGATSVAIQTAQIFRGITISKDGTILSQNARATRSNRGNKTKRGEKSRQAAKIDKAKDLVEESILTGKDPQSNEPANMVSLVIIGEYDDMKHLVRDGSKKLREADGLPDEALLAVNRTRRNSSIASPVPSSPLSTSHGNQKHRVPPSYHQNQRDNVTQVVEKSNFTHGLTTSAPPKLKSNPRDRPKSRRHNDEKARRGFVTDSCNDILENNKQSNTSEGDWRDALGLSKGFHSIWNCGGAEEGGTVSPTQICSPREGGKNHALDVSSTPQQPVYEGRDTNFIHFREGELSSRAK